MKENESSGGFLFKVGECYERIDQYKKALLYYLKAAEIRRINLGLHDNSTILAIKKCIILSAKLDLENTIPDWIKYFKNSN